MTVDLTVVGVSIVAALGYALYGIARAKVMGKSIDGAKLPATLVAAVFLAIVAPELIPTAPDNVFLLPEVALTAFSVYGAIFVLQRLYDVGEALFELVKDKLRASDFSLSVRPKVRKKPLKSRTNPQAEPALHPR